MNLDIPTLKGGEDLHDIFNTIIKATLEAYITEGFDLDGTMVHAKPGEHENVPHDPQLEQIFLRRNRQTGGQSYPLTGRPRIFIDNLMPNTETFRATEHGSVLHLPDGTDVYRIGDPQIVEEVMKCFNDTRKTLELLQGVQIEDHKTVSGTIGFTHLINPHNLREIDVEALQRMEDIKNAVVDTLQSTIDKLGIKELQVVPTVTPTNAVVELLFEGACKAESIRYARQQGWIKRASTNVFCGDSNGDKSVMEMIASEPGGIALGVGQSAPNCSHVVFAKPEHLRAFFGKVITTVDERQKALSPQATSLGTPPPPRPHT